MLPSDITRAAALIIRQRGNGAELACLLQASSRHAKGDPEAADIWLEVARAVRDMLQKENAPDPLSQLAESRWLRERARQFRSTADLKLGSHRLADYLEQMAEELEKRFGNRSPLENE